MKCILNPFSLCYHNISSEEYYLNNFDEDVFCLYVNAPCVVIGQNQNAYSEINNDFLRKNNIKLVRRLSGGGAVYHDNGNLNYSFIISKKNERTEDVKELFQIYSAPILIALQNIGVQAELSGRNDLTVDGKKISGIAQYQNSDKIILHGTLLYNSNLDCLIQSLNVSEQKIQGKGIKSIRSRVTNISEHINDNAVPMKLFSGYIMKHMVNALPEAKYYKLTSVDIKAIEEISQYKYSTDEWNYRISPPFTYHNSYKYLMGNVEIYLYVEHGMIKSINILGDYFGSRPVKELENLFCDKPYSFELLSTDFSETNFSDYIYGMDKKTFLNNLFL